MKNRCIVIILHLFIWGMLDCYAQTDIFNKDSLTERFVSQLSLFPQEKVYLHIDKGTYMAGDTLT